MKKWYQTIDIFNIFQKAFVVGSIVAATYIATTLGTSSYESFYRKKLGFGMTEVSDQIVLVHDDQVI